MAEPITSIKRHIPTEEEVQQKTAQNLMAGATNSEQGLLKFMDIVQEMNEAGYLDIMQGLLKNREGVYQESFELIKTAGLPVVLKNLVTIMQFLSTLDPHKVQRLMNAVSRGLDQAVEPNHEHSNLFGMYKSLRDPEVNRAITAMFSFLRGVGEDLDKDQRAINKEMNRDKEEMMDEI